MASVKISELPELNTLTGTEFIVANDGDVTKKVVFGNTTYTKANTVSFYPPTGCSMTVNDNPATTIPATVYVYDTTHAILTLDANKITVTNNTSANVNLSFTTSGISSLLTVCQPAAFIDGVTCTATSGAPSLTFSNGTAAFSVLTYNNGSSRSYPMAIPSGQTATLNYAAIHLFLTANNDTIRSL